jgi:hypothetical protein
MGLQHLDKRWRFGEADLALDEILHLENLRFGRELDAHVTEDGHQLLAVSLELLTRTPYFAGAQVIVRPNATCTSRAKSREIESPDERRKRLVKNRIQRERYGVAHRRRRRQFARQVEAGEAFCNRCGEPISPDEPWDLDHDDVNPRIELPAHVACNRAAASRCITSREWRRGPTPAQERFLAPARGLAALGD